MYLPLHSVQVVDITYSFQSLRQFDIYRNTPQVVPICRRSRAESVYQNSSRHFAHHSNITLWGTSKSNKTSRDISLANIDIGCDPAYIRLHIPSCLNVQSMLLSVQAKYDIQSLSVHRLQDFNLKFRVEPHRAASVPQPNLR